MWASKLMRMDFEIQYQSDKENGVANALSRKMIFLALSTVHLTDFVDWNSELQHNPYLQGIIHDLIQDSQSHLEFLFRNQKLFYKGMLVLVGFLINLNVLAIMGN